ncbi:MAG: NBR1-Ig-like domain-containing protein [Anaerolineales bacterium]
MRKYKILVVMLAGMLVLSACGGTSQNQNEIATAVALTVQAQNAQTQVASLPTSTSMPSTPSTDVTTTPDAAETAPATTKTLAPNPGCTLSANLAQEDPPDGKIFAPGESFLKSWSLQNTGTCTWDKTYKLVYWDGDLIGGAVSYDLPVVIAPGETKEIPILLQAPASEGSYRGYWRLKSPWGYDFGVGSISQSFYVDIIVSSNPKSGHGVTSIVLDYEREPLGGCPYNPITYTFSAKVTTNGKVKVKYYWLFSDGGRSETFTLMFDDAGTKTVTSEPYVLHMDSKQMTRTASLVIESPQTMQRDINWTFTCQ